MQETNAYLKKISVLKRKDFTNQDKYRQEQNSNECLIG